MSTPIPNYNSNQLTDMIMSNMLMSKIGNIMDTDFAFTLPNLLKILAFLSANEIKNGVNTLLLQFVDYIRRTPEFLFKLLNFFTQLMKPKPIEMKMKDEPNTISIDMEPNFMLSFCNYIMNGKNKYNQTICDAVIKNTKENTIQIKIDGVVLPFEHYELQLVDSLTKS